MSSKHTNRIGIWVAVMAMIVMASPAVAQEQAEQPVFELESPDWSFDASIYGVLLGMDGEVGGNAQVNGESQPVVIDFNQLTEYSNFGGGLRFAAHKNRWTILTDWVFVNVDVEQTMRNPEDSRETAQAKNKMKQVIGELTGFYLFAEHWEFLLGLRGYRLDNDLSIADIQVLDGTNSWADFYTGLRFRSAVWDTWIMSFRGDVGVGGSKVSTYFDLRAKYFFSGGINEGFWAEVGLRSNYMNREDGHPDFTDYFRYKASTTGFFFGVGYSF